MEHNGKEIQYYYDGKKSWILYKDEHGNEIYEEKNNDE